MGELITRRQDDALLHHDTGLDPAASPPNFPSPERRPVGYAQAATATQECAA
jgi:hypothetical protein